MAFLDDIADLCSDTITAQPGGKDAFGDWTASGDPLNPSCKIMAKSRLVRANTGEEVVSSVQVIIPSNNNLTTTGYRFTLPARFDPRTDLEAIAIEKVSDEDGALYEKVIFP